MGAIVERLLHGRLAARGVEDQVEKAVSDAVDGLNAQPGDEGAALRADVERSRLGPGRQQKLDRGEPDRAGADNERILSLSDAATLNGVLPDSERLDQGELLERELLGLVQQP